MGLDQTSFFTVKETINKTKRQPTERDNIFANNIHDQGSIFKIYKEFTQILKRNLTFKRADLNRHFPKGDTGMANRHTKRCSTSLIIREMHIKDSMTYYLKPLRMTYHQRDNK